MVDKTLRFNVEAGVTNAQDVARLLTSLEGGEKSVAKLSTDLKQLAAQFKSLISQAKEYNDALRGLRIPGAGSLTLRSATNAIQAGGPDTQLINASIRGQIAQFQASADQMFAKLTTTFLTGIRNFNKAVENEAVLRFANTRQSVASGDLGTLRQQIEAQQFRVNQANQSATGVVGVAAYEQEKLALDQLKVKEAELAAAAEGRDAIQQKIAVNLERQATLERQLTAQQAAGNELEAIRTQIKIKNLEIDRALLENSGRVNASIRAQAADAAQLNAQLRQAQTAQRVTDSRSFTSARLFGDGGQNLFQIQAQLLTNYLIMNKLFDLVNFGKDFVVQLDQAFHQLQAITATTNTEMVELQKNLIAVSQGSKFTAVEIAQASVILGQAGFSAAQIKDSIQPILLFAQAAGTTLPKSVDVVTSVLNQFELQASEAGQVVNVLTAALNTSKLDVDKLALGLQYSGNVAAQSGVSFIDLTTVLSAMANAGIRSGSTLGTGLRQVITDLQAPSKKLTDQLALVGLTEEDVDIKTHGLIGVLEKLHDVGFDAANAFQGFERRGASAFLALSGQSDNLDKIKQGLLLTNAAAEANRVQMDSLENTMGRFRANLGIVADQLAGPFAAAFKVATVVLTGFLAGLSQIPIIGPVIGTTLVSLGVAFAGLKIASLVAQTNLFTASLTGIAARVATATASFGFLSTVLTTIARNPLFLSASVLFGVIGLFQLFGSSASKSAEEIDKLQAAVNTADGVSKKYGDSLKSIDEKINSLLAHYNQLAGNQAAVDNEVLEAQNRFGKLGITFDENVTKIDDLIGAYRRLRGEIAGFDEAALQKAQNASKVLTDALLAQAGASLGSTNQVFNQRFSGTQLLREFGIGFQVSPGGGVQLGNTAENPVLQQVLDFFKSSPSLKPGATSQETLDVLRQVNTTSGKIDQLISQLFEGTGLGEGHSQASRDELIKQLQHLQSVLDPIRANLAKAADEFSKNKDQNAKIEAAQFAQTPAYGGLQGILENVHLQGSQLAASFNGKTNLATRQDLLQFYSEVVQKDQEEFNKFVEDNSLTGTAKQVATTEFNTALGNVKATLEKLRTDTATRAGVVLKTDLTSFEEQLRLDESKIRPDATIDQIKSAKADALATFDKITAIKKQQIQKELEDSLLEVVDPAAYKRALDTAAAGRSAAREQLIAKFDEAIAGIERTVSKVPASMERWKAGFDAILKGLDTAYKAIDETVKVFETKIQATSLPQFRNQYSDVQRKDLEDQLAVVRVAALGEKVSVGEIELAKAKEIIDSVQAQIDVLEAIQKQDQKDLDAALASQSKQGVGDARQRVLEDTRLLGTARDALTQKTQALGAAQENLNTMSAEYDVLIGNNLPKTLALGDAIEKAFNQYIEATGGLKTFTARFTDEMRGLFDSMGNAFATFAVNVASHSQSIGKSFRDLATSIIKSMADIAAKEVATGLFGFVKQALGFGGAGNTIGGAYADSGVGIAGSGSLFGDTGPLAYAGGGFIRAAGGVRTRDNIPVLGRDGEFLLRNSAVDSIGENALSMLNAFGNRKIQSSAPAAIAYQREPDMVNVYLLPKDTKPSLGPKDVLMIVQDDIARGGNTKQLIKQVKLGATG